MDKEEVVMEDGQIGYKWPDGAIRDAKGSYLVRPPYASPMITKDNAKELVEHRWELIRDAAAKGLMQATDTVTEPDAAQRITNAQGELSLDTEKGHASTKAAEFVFRAAGWLRPKDTGAVIQQAFVTLPRSVLKLLGEE